MAVRIADYEAYTFNMCADCGRNSITWRTRYRREMAVPFCEYCGTVGQWLNTEADVYTVYIIPTALG